MWRDKLELHDVQYTILPTQLFVCGGGRRIGDEGGSAVTELHGRDILAK